MEEKINKIVELEIDIADVELDDMGVEVVSLVTEPAIEVDFLSFNKECEDCFDLDGACWPGYEAIGTKMKDGREVPNCVPIKTSQQFESYNDYPESVRNNAKRGIELNESEDNKCATQVGKVRAQQLAKGENITVDTIKRMYSYLSRSEVYYDEGDTKSCGYISYLLWGGKAAKRWAESKLKELGEIDMTSDDEMSFAILDWAEESGEDISTTYFIDESEFNFADTTAVQRALMGWKLLNGNTNEPEKRWKYSGPPAERGFCRGMLSLNKMYGEKDFAKIESKLGTLNPKMGEDGAARYDVFQYKGGVSCRHHWTELAVWYTDNGTVVINRGPAEGNAGKTNNKNSTIGARGAVSNNASTKYPGSFKFSFVNEEKRLVAGPLMIPNQMILRRTPEGDPYYVYFSKDTIKRIQERFNRENKINYTDTQHDGNIHQDNTLIEQWVVESNQYDKSKFYGFDRLPLGTWFGVYKINNDEDWARVKSGELKGFSVQGSFIEKAKPIDKDERTLSEIINILKEIK